jgi:hypothetical protein
MIGLLPVEEREESGTEQTGTSSLIIALFTLNNVRDDYCMLCHNIVTDPFFNVLDTLYSTTEERAVI